jgi:hypothetical protein
VAPINPYRGFESLSLATPSIVQSGVSLGAKTAALLGVKPVLSGSRDSKQQPNGGRFAASSSGPRLDTVRFSLFLAVLQGIRLQIALWLDRQDDVEGPVFQ